MSFNEFFNNFKDKLDEEGFDVSTLLLEKEFQKISVENGYSPRAV